jgi:hypothetical protein
LAALLAVTLFSPQVALAADEECDLASPIFASPAHNLCVPAIGTTTEFVLDGFDSEWTPGIFYDHTEYFGGGFQQARVRVSRKARGIDKSDLFLFFEATGDAVAAGLDEIRIGLNPGTTSGNSTLIKIHPFNVMPTLFKDTFTFNSATGWSSAGSGDAWMPAGNVAVRQDVPSGTWFAEIKISLDAIPVNPITTPDFRLYLEMFANDGVTTIDYQWPAQYGFLDQHDFICSNPSRWHPMSFTTGAGGNCPHPDVNIAGGLYSCDAIYVLRNGLKSREIAINQNNEFHVDVTNPGPGNAPDMQVYLTLMSLGISTSPLAMNYSHTDAAIVNFFDDRYGSWMVATDSLDTGTPKPPTLFSVNAGLTNTAARFTWRPADETRFGDPSAFVDGHKCTAAFVNFKDDPNFANNFSNCNTSIVLCPSGEICAMAFTIGQFYPYLRPIDGARVRFTINAINEPFEGWFKRTQFKIAGSGTKQIRENLFELPVPEKKDVPLKLSITPPRTKDAPPNYGTRPSTPSAQAVQKGGSDPIKDRNARLRKIYGDRPLIVLEGLVPTSFETGLTPRSREQLYAPSAYVAFAIDNAPAGQPGGPKKGCGKSGAKKFTYSSLFILIGLTFAWRRSRARRKNDGTRRKG